MSVEIEELQTQRAILKRKLEEIEELEGLEEFDEDEGDEEFNDEPEKPNDETEEPNDESKETEELNDESKEPEEPQIKSILKKKVRILSRNEIKKRSDSIDSEYSDYQSDTEYSEANYFDSTRYDGTINIEKAQEEIIKVVNSFKIFMDRKVKEVKKYKKMKLLTKKCINDTIAYHDDLKNAVEDNIDIIMDAMRETDEFSPKFDRKIDRIFTSIATKLNKLII